MFGLDSPGVYLAYAASILSAIACIVYGLINWNKGYIDEEEEKKSVEWEEHEKDINDTM